MPTAACVVCSDPDRGKVSVRSSLGPRSAKGCVRCFHPPFFASSLCKRSCSSFVGLLVRAGGCVRSLFGLRFLRQIVVRWDPRSCQKLRSLFLQIPVRAKDSVHCSLGLPFRAKDCFRCFSSPSRTLLVPKFLFVVSFGHPFLPVGCVRSWFGPRSRQSFYS